MKTLHLDIDVGPGRMSHEHKGRGRGDASTGQGTPKMASHRQTRGEGTEQTLPRGPLKEPVLPASVPRTARESVSVA